MAATLLTYADTGIMMRETYADLYDKAMDSFLKRSANIPLQGGRFFVKEKATTLSHKLTTWSNELTLPGKSEDADPLPLDQPAPGYDKTINLATYRVGTGITRTLMKIDQSGKAGQLMLGLLDAGKRLVEYMMADVIINGTATEGSDGSYLFATDHYHERGSAGTWSNYESAAALTTGTYNTARLNMRKRKSETGMVSGIMAKTLFGPSDLEEKMRQISGSDKVPESSLNAMNPWQGVDFFVYDYLTDTNGWGVVGSLPEDMWGLHYVSLTDPEVKRLGYPTATYPDIVAGYELYAQIAAAGSQVKNMHWNIGA